MSLYTRARVTQTMHSQHSWTLSSANTTAPADMARLRQKRSLYTLGLWVMLQGRDSNLSPQHLAASLRE